MPKKVIVECNPDELLALTLGVTRKDVVHQNCKGDVCNYLEKNDVKFAIIDEDPESPGQPKYLESFTPIEEKFGVRKLCNTASGKIVLVIKPRLEEWIISQCKKSNINLADFFLPADAKGLKKVINLRLNHFDKLLQKLKEKNNDGILYLKSVIT